MQRDEVIRELRQLRKLRTRVERMEEALKVLNKCEREIIEKMYIESRENILYKLCEKFDIEVASVYRRRNKALKKLQNELEEMRE